MNAIKQLLPFLLLLPVPPLWGQLGNQLPVADEATVAAETFTGVLTSSFSNGVLKFRKDVTRGQASGSWQEWYPDGTLRFRSWWKDNRGHGKWEYFYPNGQLRSVGVYEEDRPVGLHYAYHPNGQLAEETPYVNGRREGIVSTFAPDGSPLVRQRYAAGARVLDRPVLFEPGKISTRTNNEWSVTFTPSGDTLYLTGREAGSATKQISVAVRSDGQWSNPVPAAFARPDEGGAFITQDGRRMYTETIGPLNGSQDPRAPIDANLWYRTRQGQGWSAPQPLGPAINRPTAPGEEWPANYASGPATDPAGNLYYWTKGQNSTYGRLYRAQLQADGSFAPPQELASPPNGTGWDVNPVISPDGNFLLFASSDREDSYGGEDLYYSRKTKDGGWSAPRNLGPDINSAAYDRIPRFSPDGKYLFFSSDRAGDQDADGDRISSIYYLETKYLLID